MPIQFLKALLPDPLPLDRVPSERQTLAVFLPERKTEKKRPFISTMYVIIRSVIKEVGSQAISYTTGVPAMIGAALVVDKVWTKTVCSTLKN